MAKKLSDEEKQRRLEARQQAKWLERMRALYKAHENALGSELDIWVSMFSPGSISRSRQALLEREAMSPHIVKLKPLIRQLHKELSRASRAERRQRVKDEEARWRKAHPGRSLASLNRALEYPDQDHPRDEVEWERATAANAAYWLWKEESKPMPAEVFKLAA
jgi:hypothetical protein